MMQQAADSRPLVSVVAPVFNEEAILPEFYRRVREAMDGAGERWELVLVNDGSRDRSPEIMRELHEQDPRVKVVSFARNFGHQVAITAGMDYAAGDAVAIIDADLQDPPEVIVEMLAQWRAGYQVIFAIRAERKGETWFKEADREALLSHHLPHHRYRHPDGYRRLPADGSQGSECAEDRCVRSIASCAACRYGWVSGRPGSSMCGLSALPARRSIRSRRCCRFALDGITTFLVSPAPASDLYRLSRGRREHPRHHRDRGPPSFRKPGVLWAGNVPWSACSSWEGCS